MAMMMWIGLLLQAVLGTRRKSLIICLRHFWLILVLYTVQTCFSWMMNRNGCHAIQSRVTSLTLSWFVLLSIDSLGRALLNFACFLLFCDRSLVVLGERRVPPRKIVIRSDPLIRIHIDLLIYKVIRWFNLLIYPCYVSNMEVHVSLWWLRKAMAISKDP